MTNTSQTPEQKEAEIMLSPNPPKDGLGDSP